MLTRRRLFPAIALGVLAVAVAGFVIVGGDNASDDAPANAIRGDVLDLDAAGPFVLSPALYVLDIASGDVWRVLDQAGYDFSQGSTYAWSEDGAWLVSASIGNFDRIVAVSADGRERREIEGQAWSVVRLDDGSFVLHMRPGRFEEEQPEIIGKLDLGSMTVSEVRRSSEMISVSPDGRYAAEVNESKSLELAELQTGSRRTLFSRPAGYLAWSLGSGSAWSPDSTRVVLADYNVEAALLVVDVRGGKAPVELASNANGATWSPDGTSLAYIVSEYRDETEWRQNEYVEVRRADGSRRAVWIGLGSAPAWSPDGEQLAFTRNGEIWRVELDSGREKRLVASALPVLTEPRWSPDGRYLAFRAASGGGDILTIDADGRNERLVGYGIVPKWSPDGERIAFLNGGGFGFFGWLAAMKADGSDVVALGEAAYTDSLPACSSDEFEWSPDGRAIAYWSDEVNQGVLAVVPSDGSSPPKPFGVGLGASWSPDSQRLTYAGPGQGRLCAIYTVAAAGGQPTLLIGSGTAPKWSPDGNWIAFEPEPGTGDSELTLVSPDDPSVRRSLGAGWDADWSADSRLVAFYKPRVTVSPSGRPQYLPAGLSRQGSLVVQPITQGSLPIAEIPVDGFLGAFDLSPDGSNLVFTVAKDGPPLIYVVDVTDPGNLRLLGEGTSPSWSPDGRTLVFSRYH